MKFLISWSNSPATIDAALETIARLDCRRWTLLAESLGVNHLTTYYRNDFSGFSVVEALIGGTVTHFCRLFPGSMIEPVFDRDEAASVAKRIVETRQQLPTGWVFLCFGGAALPEDKDREPKKSPQSLCYWVGARQKCVWVVRLCTWRGGGGGGRTESLTSTSVRRPAEPPQRAAFGHAG
jgi:hypothetical protein